MLVIGDIPPPSNWLITKQKYSKRWSSQQVFSLKKFWNGKKVRLTQECKKKNWNHFHRNAQGLMEKWEFEWIRTTANEFELGWILPFVGFKWHFDLIDTRRCQFFWNSSCYRYHKVDHSFKDIALLLLSDRLKVSSWEFSNSPLVWGGCYSVW